MDYVNYEESTRSILERIDRNTEKISTYFSEQKYEEPIKEDFDNFAKTYNDDFKDWLKDRIERLSNLLVNTSSRSRSSEVYNKDLLEYTLFKEVLEEYEKQGHKH